METEEEKKWSAQANTCAGYDEGIKELPTDHPSRIVYENCFYTKNPKESLTKKRSYCPCGGIILEDTEGWKVPLCDECYTDIGEPKEDPNGTEWKKGLEAWLPMEKETNEFYKCKCGDPNYKVCYSPFHRNNHAELIDSILAIISNAAKVGFSIREIEISKGIMRDLVGSGPGFWPEIVYFNGPDGKVLIRIRKEDGSRAS